jgi:hypothetical protein
MAHDTVWRDLHQRWVQHILHAIGDSGNVIIDLMNEGAFAHGITKAWIEFTLDIIEHWEKQTGNDLLVGMDLDHFYKKNEPELEYILAHPRMELIIAEGSEGHIVPELVAGARRPRGSDLPVNYRKRYRKPIVSTNSPGYSFREDLKALRLYQWYSMMVKVQGVGVYAKSYWLVDFSSAPVQQYAQESAVLMRFFHALQDYAALDLASEKISAAPGERQLALASSKESVVYLHSEAARTGVKSGEELVLEQLALSDGPVAVLALHPNTGMTSRFSGTVRDGRLPIGLPAFSEDLALHIVPHR